MSWDRHMARVYLSQARASRHHSSWHAVLMGWAAARRRASMVLIGQGSLF